MKVTERSTILDTQLGGTEAVRTDAGPAAADGATIQTGDRVSVSDTARALAELRARVGDPGTIRPERVAVLQAAVDAGRYQADPQDVARSLLREIGSDALV